MIEPGAEVGVRPVHDEQVREAGNGHPEVGIRAFAPGLVQVQAAPAADLHRRQEPGALEAGGENDHVGWSLGAVLGDHAALGQPPDPLGYELDVGAVQRGVVVRRDQDALAAEHVIWRQCTLQLRVGDLLVQVPLEHAGAQLPDRAGTD